MLASLNRFLEVAVGYAWGMPLVVLLIGSGAFFCLYLRLRPLLHIGHATAVTLGKYDSPDDPGHISHFQALSTALAATIGVGNIGGVAIAVTQGGAGAVFWMWVAAFVGMATKFCSCTLSQIYRRPDERGALQGGPMYTIELGLGRKFKPLAIMFCSFGLVGCLPMFQSNQVAELLEAQLAVPPLWTGLACVGLVALVAFGGVERIGAVTARFVPVMCLLYLGMAICVLVIRSEVAVDVFGRIFRGAFTGTAATGAAIGIGFQQALMIGVRRAAFSNEAGLGTAPIAHGAAKTNEPVREGLVAMLGPFIDTIVVCSLTAFVILSSGLETVGEISGVSLTADAVQSTLGMPGRVLLVLIVMMFAVSTMVSYSYYGKRCFAYLFGAKSARFYTWLYLIGLFGGAIGDVETVVNLIDSALALMAMPNLIATLLLAPKVKQAAFDYFDRLRAGGRVVAGP